MITTKPGAFRFQLRAHVATMAPFGFNAHALGVLAARHPYLVLGSPDAMAAQYAMLREVFQPWSDELAQDLSRTAITRECLPAVARDAPPPTPSTLAAASKRGLCSLVHKAMLAGHTDLLRWTRDGLEAHSRRLVAAGLFESKEDARRECLLRSKLLASRKLEWYLERRVAVLEAGGTADDVLAACTQSCSLRVLLERLLYIRAKCDAELGLPCQRSNRRVCAARVHGLQTQQNVPPNADLLKAQVHCALCQCVSF